MNSARFSVSRRSITLILVLVVAAALVVVGIRSAPPGGARPGAAALETRLLAPCCFNGTLDTHESELAHTLRHEIEGRIASGETSEQVEADLVTRYGPKIRALPHEGALTALLGAAMLLAVAVGAVIALRMRRWRRSSDEHASEVAKTTGVTTGAGASTSTSTSVRVRDAYDARIDAELAEIE